VPGKQRPGTVGLPYDGVQSRIDPDDRRDPDEERRA
jgi:hypothetical protein